VHIAYYISVDKYLYCERSF